MDNCSYATLSAITHNNDVFALPGNLMFRTHNKIMHLFTSCKWIQNLEINPNQCAFL